MLFVFAIALPETPDSKSILKPGFTDSKCLILESLR
jgi:hypothetical protein